ncbi:hypothetical protein [Paenibacillus chungangensis]|uniref:NodB homology domain-containing protein n=1 Tax=Paenibacillus chungangensis TaxID=696535 RepID=A0ABW3HUK4_9BACL
MRMASVGILLDKTAVERRHRYGLNVFESYIGEVLGHTGMPYEWIDGINDVVSMKPDVLIVACMDDNQAAAEVIWSYAEAGGIVISYGGLRPLASRLGCHEDREIQIGYALTADEADRLPLRCLNATPWKQANSGAYSVKPIGTVLKEGPNGSPSGAALLKFQVGQGFIERWSMNIPATIVRFQQGTGPVISDGIPARDGTGAVDEDILKADDRIALDWDYDRMRTETGAPYFAYPYADLWREKLLGHLLQCVASLDLTLPFIGYWPDGVSCVAMISHDSDLNIDDTAETTLKVLKECGIHSSWCMIEPGYSPSIYEKVISEGHELAFHFNALVEQQGQWDRAEFDRQYQWLKDATGLEHFTSNKNHYTRFEGWGELFEWCEQSGIGADQTRGPSKKGNIGFLFGTCHPYFPIAWFDEGNRPYNVLEISFLTQDLDHWNLADSSVIVPFLEQVRRVEGVAHFLFHQVHIHEQPAVAQALGKVVSEAVSRGFQFWTSKQVNDWERARRKARIAGVWLHGEVVVEGAEQLENAVVYVPVAAGSPDMETEMRFGVPCRKIVLNSSR